MAERARTDDLAMFRHDLQSLNGYLTDLSNKDTRTRRSANMTLAIFPDAAGTGDAFIESVMLHRLATLAVMVRIYEKKNGRLPSALEALSKVGIDVSKVTPFGDKPFGYKVEDQVATLWGFSLQEHIETPDMPPISDESNENAEQNKIWVWCLPARVRRR